MKRMRDGLFIIGILIISFIIKIAYDRWYYSTFIIPKPEPTMNNIIIDKLKYNDSIKRNINQLNKDKNYEMEQTKTISNDSTRKLFNKLISE